MSVGSVVVLVLERPHTSVTVATQLPLKGVKLLNALYLAGAFLVLKFAQCTNMHIYLIET